MTDLGLPSKPPLGGWSPRHRFSDQQRRCLERVADTLVPPGDGFPAPSEVGIVVFAERYVTPGDQPARWYPYLVGDQLGAWLDGLADRLTDDSDAECARILHEVEDADADWFGKVMHLVYQGYYSRPEVIRAINTQLPAGRDYRQTPQPFGYSETIDDWDDDLIIRAEGGYLATEEVRRVDLPDTLAGQHQVIAPDRSEAVTPTTEVTPTTSPTAQE